MKKFLLVLAFITGSFVTGLNAQTDTLFWFVAPDVSSGIGDNPIKLYFNTYSQASSVTISMPARIGIAPVVKNIAANSTDSLDLSALIDSVENKPANTVNRAGILIQATTKISTYYMVNSNGNKEIFTLKGQKAIGVDFFEPAQQLWDMGSSSPQSFSSIEVVATQNNTTVLITPRYNVVGHPRNISFSVILNKGETYSARDTTISKDSTLAGSIISSNKPIAVTAFSGGVNFSGCLSTLGDQITSSDYLGMDHVVNKGTGVYEGVFVLATQNNTSVTFNDGGTPVNKTINWSENAIFTINNAQTFISASKPVYVWHVTNIDCKMSAAQVPAMYCHGTYSVSFNRPTNDTFAVSLFTRAGYENSFAINGNTSLITGSAFSPVPGTGGAIVSAKIFFSPAQVPAGVNQLITNSGDIFGCAIHDGSPSRGGGYGFISEFSSYPTINAGPSTATVCSNSSYAINGTVGGGNVAGTWSTNGLGTFVNGTSALTNTYVPSPLDTLIKPVVLILTTNGPCTQLRDTIQLTVNQQPYVNAGADQIICSNNAVVQLGGTVSLGTSTGVWSTSGTGNFSPNTSALNAVYTATPSDTAAGQIWMMLTSTNNGSCGAVVDSMKVTITDAPSVDAGPASVSICANNANVPLNGTLHGSASSAKWTSSGTGVFNPNNLSLNATYTPSSTDIGLGNVLIKLTSTNNGPCIAAVDSIAIHFTPAPLVNAGANIDACKNDSSFVLNGSVTGGSSTGIWSGGAGTFSPGNTALNATYMPTATELAAGSLMLTLASTNNGTCVADSDNVQVNFRDFPFPNFSFNTVCLNSTTNFNDNSLAGSGSLSTWNWNFGDGNSSTTQSPTHTYATAGSFTVQLLVKNTYNCKDSLRKTLQVYPKPAADFGITRQCSGSYLNMLFVDSSTIAAPDTITTWFWDFGGVGTSSQQSPTKYFPGAGNYYATLIVTSNHNCKDTLYKPFSLVPRAKAGFYFSFTPGQNTGSEVVFTDTSKFASSWNWSFGDSIPGTSFLPSPTYTYYSNGNYVVTQVVHDSYGCTDTARHVVKINNVTSEIANLIPNAISPNGDGKNDFWHLEFIQSFYPTATIEVYDRWGMQVFTSIGYTNVWDGSYNGHQLPAGTYYYVIDLKDPKHKDPFKGSVLILR